MTKSVPSFSKAIRITPPLSECLTALLMIFERTNFKIGKFMKILVTGANGQLGRALQKVLINEEIELLLTDTKEMDITDANSVKKVFNKFEPEIVINCAAFTNVDKCETEEELAFKINAEGPRNLVKMCLEYDACLVHISTDYVFDGEKSEPYDEEDIPNPQSVYGLSLIHI